MQNPLKENASTPDLQCNAARCAASGERRRSHREKRALDLGIVEEIRHAALPADMALFQQVDPVGDERGEMQILLRQQQGKPLGLELDDRVRHLLHDNRRHPLGGLVEQHEQRIAHERAGNREHLLLAAAGVPSAKLRGSWRPTSRFSTTVRSEKIRRSSGVKPSPRRAIRYASSRDMSRPLKRTPPSRRASSPIMAFMVVDLPAPLRPMSATTSPRST